MDADTRHQLKSNELAEFFARAAEFRDRRVNAVAIAVVALVVLYAGYKFWNWRTGVAAETAWARLGAVGSIDPSLGDAPLDSLRKVIEDGAPPAVEAMARLRLANALLARGIAGDSGRLGEAALQLEALLGSDAPALLRAAATFQLANVLESQRDFARAKETYQRLASDPAFIGSPFIRLAAERLESLDSLPVSIEMRPGLPPPPPSAATLPAANQPAVGEPQPPVGEPPQTQPESPAAEPPPP
ncbi:MAG: hypothetical protein HRF50_15015 [Phycisphaerae bacterium]|jgi:hypothetical protein